MNTTVIPETELEAQDPDKDDVLFYTLQEVTPVSVPDPHANSEPSRRAAPLHVPQGLRLSRTRPPHLPRVLVASSPCWAPTCPPCGWTGPWTSTSGRT